MKKVTEYEHTNWKKGGKVYRKGRTAVEVVPDDWSMPKPLPRSMYEPPSFSRDVIIAGLGLLAGIVFETLIRM